MKTNYFPHDYHARHDPKLVRLVRDYGYEGLGLYWALVELIYESDGALLLNLSDAAYDLRTTPELLKSISETDLFYTSPDGFLKSHSIDARLEEINHKKELARASVQYRWDKAKNTNVLRTQYDGNARKKEKKEKKIKEKQEKEKKENFPQPPLPLNPGSAAPTLEEQKQNLERLKQQAAILKTLHPDD